MISLADIRADAERGTAADRLAFAHFMWKYKAPPYEEWVVHVEEAIYLQILNMAGFKNYLKDHKEDGLTVQVIQGLRMLSLDAHMAMVNGNCDVTIRYMDYLWLGEAKIARSVSVVWEGFLQLTTRYATGMPGQTSGGMLIYCTEGSSEDFMRSWRDTLSVELNSATFQEHGSIRSSFWTQHASQVTGSPLKLIHMPFPLFHQPLDGKRKLSPAALAAAKKGGSKVVQKKRQAQE